MTDLDFDQRRRWQNATLTSLVNALGMLMSIPINKSVETVSVWPSIASSGLGFACLVYLWVVRRSPSRRMMSLIYLANSAAVISAFHVTNSSFAAALGPRWVPFQGDKLGTFVAAMLAPSLVTGFISIFGHVASATIQYSMFPAEIKDQIAAGEPWIVIAFGIAASVLLISRFARLHLEKRIRVAESEKIALQRETEVFQHVKDLMNTPLQTLGILIAILKEKKTYDPQTLSDMDRSVESLTKINDALARYKNHSK